MMSLVDFRGQINNYNDTEAAIPFGGYKQSGWGRDLGEHALKKCVYVLFYV